MAIDYERIKELISIVEENGLAELAVEEDGFGVTIKVEHDDGVIAPPASADEPGVQVGVRPADPAEGRSAQPKPAGTEAAAQDVAQITSPMIGVFYTGPSPDSPPYVKVGDEIEVGQTIGLIEAMKVFSEIPSEVAGRVVAIPVENAKLVQAGDVLVVVDTSPAA